MPLLTPNKNNTLWHDVDADLMLLPIAVDEDYSYCPCHSYSEQQDTTDNTFCVCPANTCCWE